MGGINPWLKSVVKKVLKIGVFLLKNRVFLLRIGVFLLKKGAFLRVFILPILPNRYNPTPLPLILTPKTNFAP